MFGLMLIFNVVNLSTLMMIRYVDIWNYLYLVFSRSYTSNNLELAIGIVVAFVIQRHLRKHFSMNLPENWRA